MAALSNRVRLAQRAAPLGGCEPRLPDDDLTGFLAAYGREYQMLRRAGSEADWTLNTRIRPGDTTAASRSERAHLALAAFAGDADYFEPVLEWLRQENGGRSHTLPETPP